MNDTKVVSKGDDSQGRIIEIDEQQVKDHLGEMVRESVEDTLHYHYDQCPPSCASLSPGRSRSASLVANCSS